MLFMRPYYKIVKHSNTLDGNVGKGDCQAFRHLISIAGCLGYVSCGRIVHPINGSAGVPVSSKS